MLMTLLEELAREVSEHPDQARILLEKIVEVKPGLITTVQMKTILDELVKLRKDLTSIAAEQIKLREEQVALRKDFKLLIQEQVRLREDFNRMTGEIEKLRSDFRELREEQVRLREDFNRMTGEIEKLREEQVRLREDFNRMAGEIEKLREDFNEMMGVVRGLQKSYSALSDKVESLESTVLSGFAELRKFAGLSFEEFVRRMLTSRLRRSGEIPEDAELRKAYINGEEVNLFLEEPLIVGEVTAFTNTVEEAEKLLRKAKIAERKYNKKPRMFLVVLSAPRKVVRELKRIAAENNIEFMVGKKF